MDEGKRMKGRVAIVTGGASGIGRACARLLAEKGAKVAIVDLDEAGARETARGLEETLTRVSDVANAEADAAAILGAWGRIDILVTAAGWSCGGTVTSTSPEDWAKVMRINVDGTWLWARAVLPAMQRQRSGAIVTIASQLAFAGGRNNSAYIASKGAIVSLTRTMALDYAVDGIRVNAVAPGATETPMLERSFARGTDKNVLQQRHAMGRLGKPGEIAAAVCFLASDEAAFITGTVLAADGGWLAA
jgi:NAD(P)-dependent dehydrogenase (short-subunit alcohol dehydrogenase family)